MRAEYIKVEPYSFKKILEVHLEKGVNVHGRGIVRGYISAEEEERYTAYPIADTPVIIRAVSEDGEERIIFYGILTDSCITRENSQLLLEIQFTAYTKLLDLTRKTRAFQLAECTYNDIFRFLCGNHQKASFIVRSEFSNRQIGELTVQYQETDWEFILRLASHFNTSVIADYLTEGVKFYFGLPVRRVTETVENSEYRLEKSLLAYQYKIQNGVTGIHEYDGLSVIVKSVKLWEIGDRVLFENRPYVVCQSVSDLDGHQMNHVYVLHTENGIKTPTIYSEKITGASIDGIVSGVKGSMVSIQMGIEDIQPSTRWYSYATVFSSPDGSGWYCMPQIGDEIRLYFPTRKEKHAYVVSSVHKAAAASLGREGSVKTGKEEEPRSNPKTNELRSPDGKLIQLSADRIVLTTGQGLSISMVDGEGIHIISSGSVNLEAKGDIGIYGSTVSMAGSTGVTITSGETTVQLSKDTVTVSGSNVKVQ